MKGSKGHTTKSPLLTNYPTCQRRNWSTLNGVGAGAVRRLGQAGGVGGPGQDEPLDIHIWERDARENRN